MGFEINIILSIILLFLISWNLQVWNSDNGALCVTYTGHADIVRCCCYSPDGLRIVSCSDDTLVKVMRQTGLAESLTTK